VRNKPASVAAKARLSEENSGEIARSKTASCVQGGLANQPSPRLELDPDTEVVTTIGSKEGICHLMLSILSPGDTVIVPNPSYPIHIYSVIISRGDVHSVPFTRDSNILDGIEKAVKETWPKPKVLMISFPNNPTTAVVDLGFFKDI
jgi:alanine-synthesizing transaminase